MLIPRLSSVQREAISSRATRLLIFDTDKSAVMFFDGSSWRALSFADEDKSNPQSRTTLQPVANAGFGTRVAISGNFGAD